ncbi:MAG: hypothetical protein ACLFR7_06310, partial [Opitutales bacterium]
MGALQVRLPTLAGASHRRAVALLLWLLATGPSSVFGQVEGNSSEDESEPTAEGRRPEMEFGRILESGLALLVERLQQRGGGNGEPRWDSYDSPR